MFLVDVAYAAELASEGAGAETSVLGSLGINVQLFVFQLINFVVVAIIIWFLILKPLTKKMAERQQIIEKSLDDAKKIDENLKKSEQQYQVRVDEAKVEYNKIQEKATADAEQLSQELKAKVKGEIELLLDQAKRNINIEKDEMVAGLKKETVNLVVSALEKIINEKMTTDKDIKIVEEMISKLK